MRSRRRPRDWSLGRRAPFRHSCSPPEHRRSRRVRDRLAMHEAAYIEMKLKLSASASSGLRPIFSLVTHPSARPGIAFPPGPRPTPGCKATAAATPGQRLCDPAGTGRPGRPVPSPALWNHAPRRGISAGRGPGLLLTVAAAPPVLHVVPLAFQDCRHGVPGAVVVDPHPDLLGTSTPGVCTGASAG